MNEFPTRRSLALMAALGMILPGCGSDPASHAHSARMQLAANYVFAACVIQRYPGSALAEEVEVWAQGIIERGDLPAEAYGKLADLVRLAPPPTETKAGKTMLLEGCLELHDSDELATAVRTVADSPG